MGQSQSNYGNVPSLKGAEKFVRDSRVTSEIPAWKEILHAQQHVKGDGLKIFIHILPPLLLIFGCIFAMIALFVAVKGSSGVGLQNVLVDSSSIIPTGSTSYTIDALSTPITQTFSIRSGEYGRSQDIQFNLPDPATMKEGSLVKARNTGQEVVSVTNTVEGTNPIRNILVHPGNQPSFSLGPRSNTSLVVSSEAGSTVLKWYPALLMDGAM